MSKSSKVSEYEQKYKEIELVGKGTQGTAMLVECKADKKKYVSKKVVLSNLSEKDQKNAILELKLLREMKHPNIVKFIESYKEKNKIIIIMEYCEYGDLSKLIKEKQAKGEQIDENMIMQWLIQICSALNFIHSKKVIHRDIKSSNIFITKSNCVKIGDFGISKQLDNSMDKANTLVGTPYYLSPEVCQNRPYTFKSDMWSLGCVIYELCALKFDELSNEDSLRKNSQDSIKLFTHDRWVHQKLPEKRPSAQDILNNQHIKKLMKEFVQAQENIVNDIQSMKQILISRGASQGEITLMEKQFQERIQKQQEQIKAQIQAQSQVIQNESSSKQMKRPTSSAIKRSEANPSAIQSTTTRESMSITQREREIQEKLSNLQSEVRKSYQRLNTPQNSAKKDKNQSNFQDSGVTVRSEMMQTSSSKKRNQQQQSENNYSDGENTVQSIAISKFEATNQKSSAKSKTGISYSSKKDQLGSTVKSFIAEDDNENVQSSGMAMSNSQQKQSSAYNNESQRTDTNSQFLTSSEGERESEEEDDDQSERYSPSMALDLIQNESILLSKFVIDNENTQNSQQLQLGQTKTIQPQKNESGIQEYSTENAIIYGSKANPTPSYDNFSETSVSLNLSLTQDSVFRKTKLGLIGLNGVKQNNEMSQQVMNQSKQSMKSQFNNTKNTLATEESILKSTNNKEGFILQSINKCKKDEVIQNKNEDNSLEEYYEDDFEEYEDDFEEYKEDEDDTTGNKSNQNGRASQKFDCHFLYESDEEKYEDEYDQLDSILDIYKGQLNNNNNENYMTESVYKFDLTEIIEESVEHSTLYSQRESNIFDL